MARYFQIDHISILLVSAGTLAFELVFARLFTLAYWHHFAGLIIALALTGFGAAGSLLSLVEPRLERGRPVAKAATALAGAGAMALAYPVVLGLDLEPLALAWQTGQWLRLGLVCLVLVIPFLFAAGHIGLILAQSPAPNRVYALNLAGSGLGCLIAAGAVSIMLPNQALYPALGLMLAGAGAQLWRVPRKVAWGLGLAGLGLICFLAAYPLPLHFAAFKDRTAAVSAQGGGLKARAWGLHGLTEIIGGPAFHYAPGLSLSCPAGLPGQYGMFVDGDLTGPISQADPGNQPPGFVPCLLAQQPLDLFPGPVLVINPGDGLGLLLLRSHEGPVFALEENPQILELMTGPWAGFSGRVYDGPGVEVIGADPARFLASDQRKYGLILLGSGARWQDAGGAGLGVSRLFTVEGIAALLARLETHGGLSISGPLMTPPRASLKLLLTIAQALRKQGADPAQALAVMRDWRNVLILIKPAGLSAKEGQTLAERAQEMGFDLVWPRLTEPGEYFHQIPGAPLARVCELVAQGRDRDVLAASPFNLRPATRDRPYFGDFFSWRLWGLITGNSGQGLAVTAWGLLFTWGGLVAVLILAGLGIGLPLVAIKPRPCGLAFFALIGLAYMLAELTLLAEAVHLLGWPALSLPLVVGLFLAVSGAGSLLWGSRPPGTFCLLAACALALAGVLLRLAPAGELILAACLAPAALFMGAPFAGGLGHISGPSRPARAWAFGVNGFFSVAGSLGASLICLEAGHAAALAMACACYVLAGAVFWARRRS